MLALPQRPTQAPLPTPSPPPEAFDEVDVRELLDTVMAGKWIIAAIAALSTAAGIGFAAFSTPIYEAEALVQIEDKRASLPGLEILTESMETSAVSEVEIEILSSRFVLGQVVDSLDLQTEVRPRHFPLIGGLAVRRYEGKEPAPAPLRFTRHAWGGETTRVDRLTLPEGLMGESLVLVALEQEGFELRCHQGEVILSGKVGEPAVSDGIEGERVEIFVSELSARPGTQFHVRRKNRLSAIRDLRGNLSIRPRGGGGILHITLQGESPDQAERILDGLTATYLRQHVERGSAEAQQSLSFLEQQLPELRAKLEVAEERFNEFRREHKAVDLSADTQNLLTQLVTIETEMAELELRMLDEGQRFADRHPRIQTLRDQRGRLFATKNELERRIGSMPDRQQEALRLQREVDVATQLYTSLLNTAQELRVVQAGTIGNVRILDEAASTRQPVKPRKKLVVLLSLLLGLVGGLAVVFTRQALQRTVEEPDEVENTVGLPVYTVIPHSRQEAGARSRSRRWRRKDSSIPILAKEHPNDPAVEGLRSFRTSLHFALLKDDGNIIAVTSPHPESGKTFVCMNAAYVLAQAGKRVLLIDADLRRGRIHAYLGRSRGPGLSEVLSEQAAPKDVISSLDDVPLDVMTTGTLPPNPSELLMRPVAGPLLKDLGNQYDLVIVDTPPVLAVTDTAVVGVHTDGVFLLVRSGKSRMPEIEASLKRLQQNDINVTGLLFNDMGASKTVGSTYRYQHYYQYHYSSNKNQDS